MLEEKQIKNTIISEKIGNKNRYKKKILRRIVCVITIVLIQCAFIMFFFFSILQIQSVSMEPTLYKKDIIVTMKTSNIKQNDIVAFRCNNKILVKRVIACEGDWIDIDDEGTVYINSTKINEPYVLDKSYGECNIKLPQQISENQVFVLGDNRSDSIDSRNLSIGSISKNQIMGKLIYNFQLRKKI